MQINENVYFLTVKQAEKIAEKHTDDPSWDIWTDFDAIATANLNQTEKAS